MVLYLQQAQSTIHPRHHGTRQMSEMPLMRATRHSLEPGVRRPMSPLLYFGSVVCAYMLHSTRSTARHSGTDGDQGSRGPNNPGVWMSSAGRSGEGLGWERERRVGIDSVETAGSSGGGVIDVMIRTGVVLGGGGYE